MRGEERRVNKVERLLKISIAPTWQIAKSWNLHREKRLVVFEGFIKFWVGPLAFLFFNIFVVVYSSNCK